MRPRQRADQRVVRPRLRRRPGMAAVRGDDHLAATVLFSVAAISTATRIRRRALRAVEDLLRDRSRENDAPNLSPFWPSWPSRSVWQSLRGRG
jgi:hypothetical protein